MSGRTWLVLGGSSAIARAFARAAAGRGADIVLAGRDLDDLERSAFDLRLRHRIGALVWRFDALDLASHAAFAAQAEAIDGELNVFLAFGLLHDQSDIERDPGLLRALVDANYTGAVSVLQHLAPLLERRGRGRIVALGSVAGDRGRPRNHVYGSAKAALHVYLDGLRARLFRHGVTVTTIKPGFVDTAMTFGRPGLVLVASPERVAEACLRHALAGRSIAYVPGFWRWIMLVVRALPGPIFNRLDL